MSIFLHLKISETMYKSFELDKNKYADGEMINNGIYEALIDYDDISSVGSFNVIVKIDGVSYNGPGPNQDFYYRSIVNIDPTTNDKIATIIVIPSATGRLSEYAEYRRTIIFSKEQKGD